MLVGQILKDKGDQVFTVPADQPLSRAAALLHERRVGALVIAEADGRVHGIISERDIVTAVAREGAGALSKPVADCMTREVFFATPTESIDELLERMTDRRVRHLPVVVDGRLAGLVSIGDLVKHKIAETQAEADGLKAYIAS